MHRALVIAVCVGFAAIVIAASLTQFPTLDEGWFASPPYNLIHHGHYGTSTIDPWGYLLRPELKHIDQRTYWVLPVHLLAQSGWYAIFGFGNFQMRMLSGLFGILALIALDYWMLRVTGDRFAAAIATILMAQDTVLVFHSAVGRMDVMCLSLGMMAQAAYLGLRERSLSKAFLVSGALLTLCGLTHPNGVILLLTFIATVLILDRGKLRIGYLVPFALPFVIGGVAYGLWAIQDWPGFAAQMLGNRAGERVTILHPLNAITDEILRYKSVYFASEYNASAFAPLKMILLVTWYGGYFGRLIVGGVKDRVGMLLAVCGAIPVLVLTFFNAKNGYYLIFIVPFFAANAGVLFSTLWRKGGAGRVVVTAGMGATLLISGALVYKRIPAFRRGSQEMDKVIADTRKLMPANGQIIAPAAFAFALGFDRVVQDDNLGYFSHRCPPLIVEPGLAPDETERLGKDAPEVLKHRNQMLQVNYQQVDSQLYRRLSCPAGVPPQ
jgi:4-amino-4-deoxy-L-arabinose transferase-like glycosyltransferase